MISSRARRIASRAAIAVLVAFHAILLCQRVATGTLLEPTVLVRWLASLALIGSLPLLRRLPLDRNRSGNLILTAVLIVALIHVPGIATITPGGHAGFDLYGLASLTLAFSVVLTIFSRWLLIPVTNAVPLASRVPLRGQTPRLSSRAPPFV